METDRIGKKGMGADDKVNCPFLKPILDFLLLLGRSKPVEQGKMNAKVMETLPCHLKMLPGENGRRAEKNGLFMVKDTFKGSEERNLRLTKTDITGNKPVPRMGRLPILFDIFPSLFLTLRIRIRKASPIGFFPLRIR